MAFYYQHVGEELAQRDIPKSIGTAASGAKSFSINDLEQWFTLSDYCPVDDLVTLAGGKKTYQVWGFPAGAERTIKSMGADDHLMLMGSKFFETISVIAYKLPRFAHTASKIIWGEDKFPVIVLLKHSSFLNLPFQTFSNKLKFDPGYHMRGNTMKVGRDRLLDAGFNTYNDLADWCMQEGAQ